MDISSKVKELKRLSRELNVKYSQAVVKENDTEAEIIKVLLSNILKQLEELKVQQEQVEIINDLKEAASKFNENPKTENNSPARDLSVNPLDSIIGVTPDMRNDLVQEQMPGEDVEMIQGLLENINGSDDDAETVPPEELISKEVYNLEMSEENVAEFFQEAIKDDDNGGTRHPKIKAVLELSTYMSPGDKEEVGQESSSQSNDMLMKSIDENSKVPQDFMEAVVGASDLDDVEEQIVTGVFQSTSKSPSVDDKVDQNLKYDTSIGKKSLNLLWMYSVLMAIYGILFVVLDLNMVYTSILSTSTVLSNTDVPLRIVWELSLGVAAIIGIFLISVAVNKLFRIKKISLLSELLCVVLSVLVVCLILFGIMVSDLFPVGGMETIVGVLAILIRALGVVVLVISIGYLKYLVYDRKKIC